MYSVGWRLVVYFSFNKLGLLLGDTPIAESPGITNTQTRPDTLVFGQKPEAPESSINPPPGKSMELREHPFLSPALKLVMLDSLIVLLQLLNNEPNAENEPKWSFDITYNWPGNITSFESRV